MRQKILLYGSALFLLALFYKDASAIPAYARQTGKSCIQCHSPFVPQLKFEGRKFKVLNYSEVNPEYDYLPDLELLKRGTPFAVRTLFTPMEWKNGPGFSVAPDYEISIYGGSRISERAGVFAQITAASDMPMIMVHQLKISYQLANIMEGKAYWGLAGGIGPPSSFDIYNSINPMLWTTQNVPLIFPHDVGGEGGGEHGGGTDPEDHAKEGYPEFFQMATPGNRGITSYLWVREKLWIQTGLFRGLEGNDPDFWGRIAFEPIKTQFAVGASAYLGKEGNDPVTTMMQMTDPEGFPMVDSLGNPMLEPMTTGGKTDIVRIGADFQFEKMKNMNFFSVKGAFSYMRDILPDDDKITRSGAYVEAAYLFNGKVGPVLQYDFLRVNEEDLKEDYSRAFLGLKYYILPNINLTAELGIDMNNTDNTMFALRFDADF